MSKRFTPLSTAVAVATASLIVAVAGCASDRSVENPAGLSRDADTTPTLSQATPTNPLDATSQPNAVDTSTTVAMPAETPTAPIAPVAISDTKPAQPISEQTPAAPVTDISAAPAVMPAQPAQTMQPSAPAYPSDTATSSPAPTTATDTSTSSGNNADQALPPRRDRH